jgi:hypothetical protein
MINSGRQDTGARRSGLGWRIALLTVGLAFCLPLQAQDGTGGSSAQPVAAQRAELELAAQRAEQEAAQPGADAGTRSRKEAVANALRERLREGDFGVGERIFVEMRGAEVPFADTVTVRAGKVITIGTLPEISLHGVLRSELQGHLTREIGRYVRDPKVTATSWVRVSVLGSVGQQGFYAFPADILLTDALMRSGGMREDTDLNKITIKRAGREVVSKDEARLAIREGRTLDQLDVRAGDEITVGQKRQVRWALVLRTVTVLLTVFFLIQRLTDND